MSESNQCLYFSTLINSASIQKAKFLKKCQKFHKNLHWSWFRQNRSCLELVYLYLGISREKTCQWATSFLDIAIVSGAIRLGVGLNLGRRILFLPTSNRQFSACNYFQVKADRVQNSNEETENCIE